MERTAVVTLAAATSLQVLAANPARKGWRIENHATSSPVLVRANLPIDTADAAEVDTIAFDKVPALGTFKLEFQGSQTTALAFNAAAAAIQTALRLLPGLALATVSGSPTTAVVGTLTSGPQGYLRVVENTLKTAGTSCIQTLKTDRAPDVGTYRLSLIQIEPSGYSRESITSELAFGADATAVQAAVVGAFGDIGLTVTGSLLAGFVFTFSDKAPKSKIKIVNNQLQSWQQDTISFSAVPDAGTVQIIYGTSTPIAFAFGSNAAALQTSLRALPGLGSVTVTGTLGAGLVVKLIGVGQPKAITIGTNSLTLSAAPVDVTVAINVAQGQPVSSGVINTQGIPQLSCIESVVRTTPGTVIASSQSVALAAILDHSESGDKGPVFVRTAGTGSIKVTEVF